ncbi:hypothetical protein B0H13DRAFT_2525002 [Mycena leptocephala]|nr:hypothetical protein B0H13DRAFT_2525002 [Mycena leptocephala]
MGEFDEAFGSILIASWLASMLYGLVLYETFEYLRSYPNDGLLRRGIVFSCLTTSLLAMIAQFANVYLPTVTFWGDIVAVQKEYWPVPTYVICNSLTGVIVDSFLIHRFYTMSKNLWISLFLGACVATGLAGAIMVSVTIELFNDVNARDKAAVAALVWTVGTASADVLIAAALIWRLVIMRNKSTFKSTQSRIRRLTLGTIQTGSATSIMALMTLIMFYARGDASNIPTAFHYQVGSMYVLTLLYNLNLRKRNAVSGAARSGSRSTETHNGNNNICMDGIHVHRTTIATMDRESVPRKLETGNYGEAIKQDPDVASFGAKQVRVADFQGV